MVGDKAVSYNETYSFYVSEAITVTANYVDDEQLVEVKATTDISKFAMTPGETKNVFSFTSTSTVPEGCTIEKAGMYLWIFTEEQNDNNWMSTTPSRTKGMSSTSSTYNYIYNLSVPTTSTYYIYIQSFVTYVNENGERFTETGDYYKVPITSGITELNVETIKKPESASSAE